MNRNSNIGLIGLGNMGKPMTFNLLKNKYDLKLYDINKILYKPFKKTQAKIAESKKNIEECQG